MNFDFYFFAVGVSPIKFLVMDNMSKNSPKMNGSDWLDKDRMDQWAGLKIDF